MVIRPKELILNQLLRGHSFINRNPHRRPDDFESLNVRELTALSTPGSPDVYGYIILNSTIDVGIWAIWYNTIIPLLPLRLFSLPCSSYLLVPSSVPFDQP